jgi:hypothetical protein
VNYTSVQLLYSIVLTLSVFVPFGWALLSYSNRFPQKGEVVGLLAHSLEHGELHPGK